MESIEATVMDLEAELLQPTTRANTRRLAVLLAGNFLEVGAAGQSFGKAEVLARLPHETGVGFTTTAMQAYLLAPTVVLVTYLAQRTCEGVTTHCKRSSLWVKNPEGWQMRYHQGTYGEPLPPNNSFKPTPLRGAA
ncbi:nuclear transport factor 2 family protein [Luteimonas sp. XNQY3]|nr:DUF4440 domain-containing protein [Luteimonas sp. XNQY3]MCD9008145.1 nuclear transport factor 2 family protein [Luteimonas sp. XNQY3]